MSVKIKMRDFHEIELQGKRAIIDWCVKEGLMSSRYTCPVCMKDMRLGERKLKMDGYDWVCRVNTRANAHQVSRSVRKGTFFEESKVNIIEMLKFAYLWVYEASMSLILNEVNVARCTVFEWRKMCREVCMVASSKKSMAVGGPGIVVELDEYKFGESKCRRGLQISGNWVYCGSERESGKCFFQVVEDRTIESLLEVIKHKILPDSIVISDCWKAYNCWDSADFQEISANHSIFFLDPESEVNTDNIKRKQSPIKQEFSKHNKQQPKDIFDSQFAELLWRKKYRQDTKADPFRDFLLCIKDIYIPHSFDIVDDTAQ